MHLLVHYKECYKGLNLILTLRKVENAMKNNDKDILMWQKQNNHDKANKIMV